MDAHLKQAQQTAGILAVLLIAALISWQLMPATSAPIIPATRIVDVNGAGVTINGDNADAVATTATGKIATRAQLYGFNGTTWDRLRGDRNFNLATDEQAADWKVTQDSAADTGQTLTRAAVSGQSHYITMACVGVRGGTAIQADVSLQEGPTESAQFVMPTAAGTMFCLPFARPYKMPSGLTANLVIPAGGTGIITIGTLQGYTK